MGTPDEYTAMFLKMARPWCNPRTGIFYVRRKVPEALRPHMGGWEYKRSLQTKDPAEALSRFPEALAACNAAFELAKKAVAGHAALNARDAQQLAARWFADERKRLEQSGEWERWLVIELPHQSGPQAIALPFLLLLFRCIGVCASLLFLWGQLGPFFTGHSVQRFQALPLLFPCLQRVVISEVRPRKQVACAVGVQSDACHCLVSFWSMA